MELIPTGPHRATGGRAPHGLKLVRSESLAVDVLLDKLGERLVFEKTGARLYDALIAKYAALSERASIDERAGPFGLVTLRNLRAEELAHFDLLCDCVESLGADPNAQTVSADVARSACSGLAETIENPRTTFVQCLNAMLMLELADNAGWDLLAALAERAGHNEMAEHFIEPLEDEAEHLAIIRTWLEQLLTGHSRAFDRTDPTA